MLALKVPLSSIVERLKLLKGTWYNVLPRPGPQPQPPPQIIGRPDDVERPGQGGAARAGGGAWRSTGHRGDGSSGCGGGRGTWGAWQKEQQPSHPQWARLLERWLPRRGLARRQRQGWPWDLQAAQLTGWVLENTLFRPQQGSEDAAVQDVRSANNMNDAGSSASGSWLQSPPEPSDSASVPAELPGKLPQLRTPEPPASAELRPAGPTETSRRPRLSFAVRAKMSVALHVKKHGGSHSRSTG